MAYGASPYGGGGGTSRRGGGTSRGRFGNFVSGLLANHPNHPANAFFGGPARPGGNNGRPGGPPNRPNQGRPGGPPNRPGSQSGSRPGGGGGQQFNNPNNRPGGGGRPPGGRPGGGGGGRPGGGGNGGGNNDPAPPPTTPVPVDPVTVPSVPPVLPPGWTPPGSGSYFPGGGVITQPDGPSDFDQSLLGTPIGNAILDADFQTAFDVWGQGSGLENSAFGGFVRQQAPLIERALTASRIYNPQLHTMDFLNSYIGDLRQRFDAQSYQMRGENPRAYGQGAIRTINR